MAELDTEVIHSLNDSQFAYIEPGGVRDPGGRTTPRGKRHFALHCEAAVRSALAQAPASPFGRQAMGAILTAARKYGVPVSAANRAAFGEPDLTDLGGFPERRFTRFPPEIRQAGDHGPSHIYGYAAAYNKLSRKLAGFVEQVAPTAFNESRANGWPDIVCRYNHHDDQLLGTTWARTLILATDETGLAYDVVPPNARSDVLEYVQRGDVKHSSFAFRVLPGGDEWGVSDFNYPMRTLLSVQLIDVAPVLDPAYPSATAAARAVNGAVESLAAWVQGDPEEVRTRMSEGRAMEFFRRVSADGGKPKTGDRKVPKKTAMTGAQALLALQANMEDPWADEG
jgi:Escherichia/Staphylococcus phage prohead protease